MHCSGSCCSATDVPLLPLLALPIAVHGSVELLLLGHVRVPAHVLVQLLIQLVHVLNRMRIDREHLAL